MEFDRRLGGEQFCSHLADRRHPGGRKRNGTRTKTVTTELGPVDVDVPRDRDGMLTPVVVRKRQHRYLNTAYNPSATLDKT